jgi:hypothetical protein
MSHLFPTIGGTASNVLESLGLREPGQGPIEYPGSKVAEMALGMSPLMRLGTFARTASDPRKGLLEKAANTLSGIKVTDVSPKRQRFELLRKAEALAEAGGAHSRKETYFSKAELEKIKETDPALYERQVELQNLLNSLKAKPKAKKAEESKGGFRLSKAKK